LKYLAIFHGFLRFSDFYDVVSSDVLVTFIMTF